MFSRLSMSSFKPCRGSLLSQLLKGPKIDCARAKVNGGQPTVKLQDFDPYNILNSYVSFDKVWITIPQENYLDHQKGKMVKIRVLIEKT